MSAVKRLLFIYNPHAGKGRSKSHISDVVDCFTRQGWLVTIHPTQGKADAAAVAADLGGSFGRVVCCGGDGTLHETITGLMGLTNRPPVGYIPAGTTNDFPGTSTCPAAWRAGWRPPGQGCPGRWT